MWETLHSIADWACFETQNLLEILRTRSQTRGVSCVFWEAERLSQSVECARNKVLSRTAPQSLRIISLDAGLRVDGILALDLRDMVIEVLRSTDNKVQPKHTSHHVTGSS